MWEGRVAAIYVAAEAEGAMSAVDEVRALEGQGLEGDRYARRAGTWSDRSGSGRELTLIEAEAIAAIAREYDIRIEARDARRNVVTEGVPLNHLVGRRFSVGEVLLEGVRLCEPCAHVSRLAGADLHRALRHRGGLRTTIVRGGVLRAGDRIEAV